MVSQQGNNIFSNPFDPEGKVKNDQDLQDRQHGQNGQNKSRPTSPAIIGQLYKHESHNTNEHTSNQRISWRKSLATTTAEDHDDLKKNDLRSKTKLSSLFTLRSNDDQDDVDWWFASTACPLLAATIAPLSNVLSIAALVNYWRVDVSDGMGGRLPDFEGTSIADPRWCYWINVGSLICGVVGNIFLLFNFTGRVRYIIALPATIFFFYLSTFMLVGITVGIHIYNPPIAPFQLYSQSFWYAVMSIILYFVASTILMINMAGYFLGHYPQRFELNDHQRTLILQTMLFFAWLASGAAVFSKVENLNTSDNGWQFADGLYFCDVTILTLGFGDLVPGNDLGRGLVFPYSVGGIIMLGLVIHSISKFAAEMNEEKVVLKHTNNIRLRTLERSTSDPREIERQELLRSFSAKAMQISRPFNGHRSRNPIATRPGLGAIISKSRRGSGRHHGRSASMIPAVHKRITPNEQVKLRHKKIKVLRHEKDRFNEMRKIQHATQRFRRWWALVVSVTSFAILWLVGSIVFWQAERIGQSWSYFDGLYFAYISLLTIGYGDFTPKSNAGRAFFVVWSLIAVPTMTLLISDMSFTVIEAFNRMTFVAADFTVLLKKNIWNDFINSHPIFKKQIERYKEHRNRKKRFSEGLIVGDEGLEDIKYLGDDDVEAQSSHNLQSTKSNHSNLSGSVMSLRSKKSPNVPNTLPTPLSLTEKTNPLSPISEKLPSSSPTTRNPSASPPPMKRYKFYASRTNSSKKGLRKPTPLNDPGLTQLAQEYTDDLIRNATVTTINDKIDGSNAGNGDKPTPPQHPSLPKLLRALAFAIQRVASDVRLPHERQYSFDEWAELMRLMRFAAGPAGKAAVAEQPERDADVNGAVKTIFASTSIPAPNCSSPISSTSTSRSTVPTVRAAPASPPAPSAAPSPVLTPTLSQKARGNGAAGAGSAADGDALKWDWLGEDSPMMVNMTEAEFVLERLCESLMRCAARIGRGDDEKDEIEKTKKMKKMKKKTRTEGDWVDGTAVEEDEDEDEDEGDGSEEDNVRKRAVVVHWDSEESSDWSDVEKRIQNVIADEEAE